ncbi:Transmembrane anterior posterior transformation protein [Trichinella pseudospiralis]
MVVVVCSFCSRACVWLFDVHQSQQPPGVRQVYCFTVWRLFSLWPFAVYFCLFDGLPAPSTTADDRNLIQPSTCAVSQSIY